MIIFFALIIGFALDLLFGDPQRLPHPVQAMGLLISVLEGALRRIFPKTDRGEIFGGAVLVLIVCFFSFTIPLLLLFFASLLGEWAVLALQSLMCWQALAAKGLAKSAMQVYKPLTGGDMQSARKQLGMIVGRDTDELDSAAITRAAVETVAENTSDGVVAPMIFFALGGAPLAFLYKAVNTMDSMVGYKNEKYLYFGRAAARTDDVLNYPPARLTGLLTVVSAFICGLDGKNSWRILKRDHKNHSSPNSGWPEAACAGALVISLGGTSKYFGVPVEKPTIGDDILKPLPEAIPKACKLELLSAALCFALCLSVRALIIFF